MGGEGLEVGDQMFTAMVWVSGQLHKQAPATREEYGLMGVLATHSLKSLSPLACCSR